MKNFIIYFILCFGVLSCSSGQAPLTDEPPKPAPVQKFEAFKSWPNQTWAKLAYDLVAAYELDKIEFTDAKKFCPNGMTKRNLVHLMAGYIKSKKQKLDVKKYRVADKLTLADEEDE